MSQPRVYVAASSAELVRARRAMDAVRAAGFVVTHDWVVEVERVGDANPVDASHADRRAWALADLDGVQEADAVWLLYPAVGAARGAFFEVGAAYAWGVPVIVSGPGMAGSIFIAMADMHAATDEVALEMLVARLVAPAREDGGR